MNTPSNEFDVATAPFDYDELLGRCVGKPELAARVLDNFAKLLPQQVEQLDQMAREPELLKLRTLAHQLKGGALTVSARRLGKLAHKLESAAEEATTTNIAVCLNELREEADRLIRAVGARYKKE